VSPRGRTRRTRRCPRRSTTRPRASRGWRRRPAPGSGERAGVRVRAVRPRLQGVHGAGVYDQKPYRRVLMETWGASVVPSPVAEPDHPGSLGLAISDAVADAAARDDTHYSLGSGLEPRVAPPDHHRIGAKEQLALAGEARPDVVIGSCGGGSNLGWYRLAVRRRCRGAPRRGRAVVVPDPHRGIVRLRLRRRRRHDPAAAQYTLGHDFVPPAIHAGGLRYHGDSPIISSLVRQRPDGGARASPGQDLRGRGAVRPGRGQDPGPRDRARGLRARSTRPLRPRRPARSA